MSTNYQKFIAVLKKWPVNTARGDRDYGFYLRNLIKNKKFNEEPFPGDAFENSEKISSLFRLAENKYSSQYLNQFKVGSVGLPIKELRTTLSIEDENNQESKKISDSEKVEQIGKLMDREEQTAFRPAK